MYNTKFILLDGKEIYPGYLDKEQRSKLKESYGNKREYMRCGCKPDANLFYRISEDCKIYPEHNNFVHSKSCCRYKNESGDAERQTAYVVNEEDGNVTAYLSFNPKSFSMVEAAGIEKDQDNDISDEDIDSDQEEVTVEGSKNEDAPAEKKEPKLSLTTLVRSINVDSFTEKILNNRKITSKEDFSKFVYYRMKKVRISRMKKTLGDMSLEKDGVRFFYLPFVEATENTVNGITKCYIKTQAPDGKVYSNFIFPKTLEKALKEYMKTYGVEPDQDTMVAGFQYIKKNNKSRGSKGYRVLGRIHLFQACDIGIYCRSLIEKDCFNQLQKITATDSDIRFWIPPEDEEVGAIVEIKGITKKILLLFRKKKNERVVFDSSRYVPYVVEENTMLSSEKLHMILGE